MVSSQNQPLVSDHLLPQFVELQTTSLLQRIQMTASFLHSHQDHRRCSFSVPGELSSATPQFAYDLAMHGASSCGTHRVATHSQKTRFSACQTGCCCCSPTLHKWRRRSLRTASKTKRLHEITAAHFTLPTTPRRRFVLDGTTRAVVAMKSFPSEQHSVQLARRFFTWKHSSSQQREDNAKGSRAEPLSNITFILASF